MDERDQRGGFATITVLPKIIAHVCGDVRHW
jgi:hypothetical protein